MATPSTETIRDWLTWPRAPVMTIVGVGGGGGSSGVTALLGMDQGPQSAALRARTVKVYAVPLVSPVTSHVSVGAVAVHEPPGGLDATS